MLTGKKWSVSFLAVVLALLVLLGGVVVVIDPFFHYHTPLSGLQYPMSSTYQRYQNDGILRHFSYDAVITGTSMTENFKTSEFDSLFSCNSIKISLSGASYKEVNDQLSRAVAANPEIKYILRTLDSGYIFNDKDQMDANFNYPFYLYNYSLLDDVNYVFNKDILLKQCSAVLSYTASGKKTPDFDAYSSWSDAYTFGKEVILRNYKRPKQAADQGELTESERGDLRENIQQNFIKLAKENPQIDFYIFFPPYNIYNWDRESRLGRLKKQLQAQEEAVSLLVECSNVHLFAFFDDFDLVCNSLDYYMDTGHYNETINSQILQWIEAGEHQLTEENYRDYFARIGEFYLNYDYDALF